MALSEDDAVSIHGDTSSTIKLLGYVGSRGKDNRLSGAYGAQPKIPKGLYVIAEFTLASASSASFSVSDVVGVYTQSGSVRYDSINHSIMKYGDKTYITFRMPTASKYTSVQIKLVKDAS
jgi:hypothetical protein